MHDVEGHTACYLRDLLATRAHRDPQVTAFLACWCYEEHWHGEAIAQVLRAHDEPAGGSRLAASRRRLPRRDALKPVAFTTGLGADPPHRRRAHDVGCGQRVDHPGRLRTPRRQGRSTRCCPSCCAGSCAKKAGTSTSTPRRPPTPRRERHGAAHHPLRPASLLGAGRRRGHARTRGEVPRATISSATTRGIVAARRIDRARRAAPGARGAPPRRDGGRRPELVAHPRTSPCERRSRRSAPATPNQEKEQRHAC